MPSSAAQPARSKPSPVTPVEEWRGSLKKADAHPAGTESIGKREVIALLKKSKRTIETYVKDGRLAAQYVQGPNGLQLTFRLEDVERLKRDIETPVPRVVQPKALVIAAGPEKGGEVGPHLAQASALQHFLAEAIRAFPVYRTKPWLTTAEAAEYSGLPAAYLLTQARSGAIRAINVGTGKKEFWRFSRRALAQ